MTNFKMYKTEADDDKAWDGVDYCGDLHLQWNSAAREYRVTGSSREERIAHVNDMGSCGEIWAGIAVEDMDN